MTTAEACTFKEKCRVSGQTLIDVLDLGELYLNAFPEPKEDDGNKYPLRLAYDRESELVQLRHTVDPELMFRNYWYASGTQEAMKYHLADIVNRAEQLVELKQGDVVVDIGCNDGTLLQAYNEPVYQVGFEPAKNIQADIDCRVYGFFNANDFRDISTRKAKIVTSIAMFYDVDEPVEFTQQVNQILDKDGVWILEMHYLPDMIKYNEVDAICHEHLAYYSVNSLQYVMRQSGMTIVDVELNGTNGGSMLVTAKHAERARPSIEVENLRIAEHTHSMIDQLHQFALRVRQNKYKLLDLLKDLKDKGKVVYGYGASTKGNTLLQYADITSDLLPKIADRNPAKHGHVTVGTRIPIISEDEMREEKPDYLLALPYHFLDSFQKREKDFKGQWISPVPEPSILP